MRKTGRIGKVYLSAIALACVALLAAPADAALDKCAGGIDIEGAKLHTGIFKALQKCKDFYHKEVVKGQDPLLKADECEIQMAKVFAFTGGAGTSKTDKAYAGFQKLITTAKCNDDDLRALGHLPTADFGDKWIRLMILMKIKLVVEEQIELVRDTITILRALGQTGNCPSCVKFQNGGRCFAHACTLAGTSQSIVTTSGGALPPLPLVGALLSEICDDPDFLPNDLASFAPPSRGLKPVDFLGQKVCVIGLGAEGYIRKNASGNDGVSYKLCQDHIVNSPDSDECPAALGGTPICMPSVADPDVTHVGVTNGGVCSLFTLNAAAPAGSSFSLATSQLTIVNPATQLGPDGIACTADDTVAPAVPAPLPLTTGTVEARVLDRNNADGQVIGPVSATGIAYNVANLRTSNSAGARLVGAFPALHQAVNDIAVTSLFDCN